MIAKLVTLCNPLKKKEKIYSKILYLFIKIGFEDLEFTDNAIKVLCSKGYVPEYGARPMKRIIKQLVEIPLTEKILSMNSSGYAGQRICVHKEQNEDSLILLIKETKGE